MKKTRRGGKARHPMLNQDAKMMSKNQDEKKDNAHIKCFKCGDMGHFVAEPPKESGPHAPIVVLTDLG